MVIVLLGIGLTTAVIWYEVQLSQVRRAADSRAERVRLEAEKELAANAGSLLRLSALPLAWAIRDAMLRQQMSDVDDYVTRMVQQPHVRLVLFADPDGTIRIASDRKLQGSAATDVVPDAPIDTSEPAVTDSRGESTVTVPIMGYDRRLGTLVYRYKRP